jgi:hypothetical protein
MTTLDKLFVFVLSLHNFIGDGLIPNLSFIMVSRASFEIFGSTIMINNNVFAIHFALAALIVGGLMQLCFSTRT